MPRSEVTPLLLNCHLVTVSLGWGIGTMLRLHKAVSGATVAFGLAVIYNLNFVQEGEKGGTEGGRGKGGGEEGRKRRERGGRSGAGRGEKEGEREEGGGEDEEVGEGRGKEETERRRWKKEIRQQKQKIWESGEVACNN